MTSHLVKRDYVGWEKENPICNQLKKETKKVSKNLKGFKWDYSIGVLFIFFTKKSHKIDPEKAFEICILLNTVSFFKL